jgi:phage terminase large subunit-like protein
VKKVVENNINLAETYIQNVLNGTRNAGTLEVLSVKRHLADLKNAPEMGLMFDKKAAQKAFAFFSLLKHSKGEFAGRNFDLSPWEAFIIYALFGWKRANNTRRFRYAYIEVARKNGKTTFAAAISLLMLIFDGEQGAEIYTAATNRGQAKICFDEAKNMINKSPALKKYIDTYQRTLVMETTLSKMEPLARDSDKLDGLNPHLAVCDEMHAWKTDDLYNVLKSATGARSQPLIFTITTAGFDKMSPCFEMRKTYIDVLNGIKKQENTFVLIFTLDEGDDWKNPKAWEKANPNLNISVNHEYLEEEFTSAINRGGSEEVNFKTKNLNLWVDAPTVWIQDEKILACNHHTEPEELKGKKCFGGLDLASHVDINAFALFFPNINGRPVAKIYYFIPEAKVTEHEDRVDYRRWIAEGRIIVTPGNVIDIDEQVNYISKIVKNYDCQNIAFDPAKAYHGTVQGLQKKGLNDILDEFAQGIRYMSEPTRELQRMVEGAEIDLLGDPILRWMFRNAVAITDTNDNIKLDKKKSQHKIDGLIALANAIGGFMSGDKIKPYESHTLREIEF